MECNPLRFHENVITIPCNKGSLYIDFFSGNILLADNPDKLFEMNNTLLEKLGFLKKQDSDLLAEKWRKKLLEQEFQLYFHSPTNQRDLLKIKDVLDCLQKRTDIAKINVTIIVKRTFSEDLKELLDDVKSKLVSINYLFVDNEFFQDGWEIKKL